MLKPCEPIRVGRVPACSAIIVGADYMGKASVGGVPKYVFFEPRAAVLGAAGDMVAGLERPATHCRDSSLILKVWG